MTTSNKRIKKISPFIFKGKFPEHCVFWQSTRGSREKDPKLETLAKQEWQKIVKKCQREGKKIWDSILYRFESFEYCGEKISFRVSTIPLSIRIGMRKFSEKIRRKGMTYAPLGMFSSCLILSRDQKYLFIEKSDNYFTTRKFSWIGGVLSKSEGEIKEGKDLFVRVKKEVSEETGVNIGDIKNVLLEGGCVSDSLNFCLLFRVELTKTFSELKKEFGSLEAKRLIGLNQKTLFDFVRTKLPQKDWQRFMLFDLEDEETVLTDSW